jgi:hypothetical protein
MREVIEKQKLLLRIAQEARIGKDFILPVHLDLHSLMCLVGALQLALRHPANTGPSSKVVRELIDAIIARVGNEGCVATAEMLRLGDHPEYDEKYELLDEGRAIKCLACGMVSHNLNDVAQLYCGNCHRFHEE